MPVAIDTSFDAAIAATAIARGDSLLALDTDFDQLAAQLNLIKA